MLFKAPNFIKRLTPSLVWNLPGEKGDVYITFDDGPTPGITEWIVETLARYDAKATFFCLGRNVERYPDSFRAILDAGHHAGNHTYSHQKGWQMSLEQYVEDVDFAGHFISSDLFRPPYGRIKPRQARVLAERYNIIMWDVLSRDYSNLVTPRQCAGNVVKHVRAGSIVVFHDSRKASRNMCYALPRVLDHIYNVKGLRCSAIQL